MPFVSFEEVSPHVAGGVKIILADPTTFAALEMECAKIIRDKTGQAIPATIADRGDSADWVILPAAWIIQYVASNHLSKTSPELEARFKTQYGEAIRILESHPLRQEKAGGGKFSRNGCIEGMYE